MGSPVAAPRGQPAAGTPQKRETRCPAKLLTQTLSSPSTAMPHGTVAPPPVKPVPGLRTLPRGLMSVTAPGLRFGATVLPGQGRSITRESDTQTLPWLSDATPIGLLRPPPVMGEAAVGVPSGPYIPTRSLPVLETNACRERLKATSNGLFSAGSTTVWACRGSPSR